jgi:peroxiredoxin
MWIEVLGMDIARSGIGMETERSKRYGMIRNNIKDLPFAASIVKI